jgi:hypothetical protein
MPASLLPPGSLVSLIFVTPKGPVVATAQMLHPVSWKEQPFRLATLLDSYKYRLRALIESSRRPLPVSRINDDVSRFYPSSGHSTQTADCNIRPLGCKI